MAERGFRATVDDAGNAVGEIGDGPTHVVLLGHIATVPGAIDARIEAGAPGGRGALAGGGGAGGRGGGGGGDAKGPRAAFVAAATKPVAGLRVTVVGAVEE